jgi:hypothetical protein
MVAHHENRAFGRVLAVKEGKMIGAKVEHGVAPEVGRGGGGLVGKASGPTCSADEGLARRTPPHRVIITERRLLWPGSFDGILRLAFVLGIANAGATEQEDVGVFDHPVGDGGGDGGVVEKWSADHFSTYEQDLIM